MWEVQENLRVRSRKGRCLVGSGLFILAKDGGVGVMSKRSPLRDKAYEIWNASGGKRTLKSIAEELGVPDNKVRKWKCMDNWRLRRSAWCSKKRSTRDNETKKVHGNVSALLGNKNAFKTGEYETIYFDSLDEEEINMLKMYSVDGLEKIERAIMLFEIRERRMLKLLQNLKEEKEDIEILNVYHYKPKKVMIDVVDSQNGIREQVESTVYDKFLTRTEEKHQPRIDRIMDVENALTRVQEQKRRAVESKEKILATNRLLDLKERKLKLEEW